MNREELIKRIQEILPFMNTWEQFEKNRWDLESKISGASNAVHHMKEKNAIVFLMVGAFYGFIISLFVMVPIAKAGLFSPYIWFGIIAIVAVIYMKFATKSNQKEIVAKEAEVAKLKEQYKLLCTEFNKSKSLWDSKIYAIFPKDYAYPSTIKTIYSYLTNYRADTLKEAFNLYEQERQQKQQQIQMEKAFDAYDRQIANMQRNQSQLEQRVADAEAQANYAYIKSLHEHE